MKLSNVLMRVVAVFVAVSVVQIVAGALAGLLIPMKTPFPPDAMQHAMFWMILTNAVTVAALSALAVRSEWRGWKLGIAVAAIPLAIFSINGLEGIIFLKNSHIEWPGIFLSTLTAAALSTPVWMWFFGRREDVAQEHFHPFESQSVGQRVWKFVACDFSYIALYLLAGSIIFPYIKDFYATQTIPPMSTLLALQLLVRGPAFILVCLLITRMLGLPRLSGALAVGAVFTLLSGVAPLLMPNPYFPNAVRWMHFMEVTSSNFVFGAIVAWMWGQRRPLRAQVLAHAA